jgi:hypothetical protein
VLSVLAVVHDCGCVHNDVDARNFYICSVTGRVYIAAVKFIAGNRHDWPGSTARAGRDSRAPPLVRGS